MAALFHAPTFIPVRTNFHFVALTPDKAFACLVGMPQEGASGVALLLAGRDAMTPLMKGQVCMLNGMTIRAKCIRVVMAAVVSGSIFQISSCTIDNGGALSALANPAALTELFDSTRLGQWINGLGGSLDIHIGDEE